MSEKLEAERLVKKLYNTHSHKRSDFSKILWPTDVQLGLATVDEILEQHEKLMGNNKTDDKLHSNKIYWMKVKEEISKL